MEHIGHIIGREYNLFAADLARAEPTLQALVSGRSFLVIGGAGSIGQAVTREIFRRRPRRLHVIDVSENNLVELVRDIRSSLGYIDGDFRTLPLDCGGDEMAAFLAAEPPYDYVLNLSALKHVRSEKDPFTLMRMIQVNVLNTEKLLRYAVDRHVRKYFGVSTDKAVNPVNAMGATKAVMELCMMRASHEVPISSARFANVAFSDGSLLHGFTQRVAKRQPLSAPRDVRRYFITPEESGQLCLLSCLLGENRDVLLPKLGGDFQLIDFPGIAERYLAGLGYGVQVCGTEDEARGRIGELVARKLWPCYFFDSDTTGEKEHEEFHGPQEKLDLGRFEAIGVVRGPEPGRIGEGLDRFLAAVVALLRAGTWTRRELLDRLEELLPDFRHRETEKFLDARM
jgi:NAD(P)-dependent dehydrogenase (short-subunit alcohol dehydrogenase family)